MYLFKDWWNLAWGENSHVKASELPKVTSALLSLSVSYHWKICFWLFHNFKVPKDIGNNWIFIKSYFTFFFIQCWRWQERETVKCLYFCIFFMYLCFILCIYVCSHITDCLIYFVMIFKKKLFYVQMCPKSFAYSSVALFHPPDVEAHDTKYLHLTLFFL